MTRLSPTWIVPGTAVAIGIVYLIAGILGGNPGFGIFGLALMTGIAIVVVAVRRRSEVVAGLLDRRDERINQIDFKATTFAGVVVIGALLVAFVVDIARGHENSPYAWPAALGGVAYLVAMVYQRFRG